MTSGAWDELVACALVGTARRRPSLPAARPGSALGTALAGIDGADAEGAVLAAGALVGLYRQAGRRPPVDTTPPPAPSPDEVRPYCSQAAGTRLDAMLAGGYRAVLPEWLRVLASARRLVPPDRLPGLLDVASTTTGLRSVTAEVAGERGRWLAALNPAWAWASGAHAAEYEATSAWATGSAAARRLLLGRLRATDPAAARDLLVSTWATESPDDRAAFVAVLATNVSMDDEPFLEAALDDRRKEVRQAAAGLLWRLPESRLAARMADRAAPHVGNGTLPAEVDPGMVRDGIVARPPAGVGQRAWWLYQLVAATPLRTWGPSPADRVATADPLLRQAWATAAVRQRDEAWAIALLDAPDVADPALLDAVPPDRAVAVTTERVARLGLTPAVLDLVARCPTPWGPQLSAAIVGRLQEVVRRPGRPDADGMALRARLPELALRVDPSPAPVLTEVAPPWFDVVGWFLDLSTFRAEMYEELPS